jgi:hypothetical protein
LNPTNYFGRLDDIFSYKIQFKITPNVDILDNLYINSIVNEDGSTFATKCLKPEGINFGLSLSKI